MSGLVAERVAVAPGDGLLARRADGVLFVGRSAEVGTSTWADAIDRFVHAAGAVEALQAVLDLAIDRHLEVGPFAVVTWDANVHLVVFGDLTVVTDLPSVPRLSGAGMPTWVEHHATRVPGHGTVRLGEQPAGGTDLIAGIVPAAGFHLSLTTPASATPLTADDPGGATRTTTNVPPPTPEPVAPPAPEAPVSGVTRTTPNPPPPPTPAPVAPPAVEIPVSGAPRTQGAGSAWDVLRDAGGGWMDDSLRLSEPRRSPPPPSAPTPGEPADTPTPATFDPEVTLDARSLAEPSPATAAPPEPAPMLRYVQARRCDAGHLNPPLRTRCRTCDHYLPPATPTETVPQPVLATLVLDDGRTIDIAGPIVLGRIPSADAAHLDELGTLVAVGDATVSRTHAVVTVDGWTLLAVDCGATGGTAVAPAGGDPTLLEPWVPHELAVGDTLFLGGPTRVNVVAPR